jgi:putative DNA primase/helicase
MSTDNAASLPLKSIARALDGVVTGDQVLAPGPSHSARDRSLSVRLSPTSPDGFVCHSFAGEDWKRCHEYVCERLGLFPQSWKRDRAKPALRIVQSSLAAAPRHDDRGAAAIALWRSSVDPRGTHVEKYLNSRKLRLDDDIAGSVLRWNPKIRAMVALFRNIETNKPQAITRTFLNQEGWKIERKFLGPVSGAAIKLDDDADVTTGLHIGEGIETCLAARQLGLKPAWALGSCLAIAAFPVLAGVQALSILREHDEANRSSADVCGTRWHAAGRQVFDVWPKVGKDVNDAIRGAA